MYRKALMILAPVLVFSLLGWLYWRAFSQRQSPDSPLPEASPVFPEEDTRPPLDFFPPQPGEPAPLPPPGEELPPVLESSPEEGVPPFLDARELQEAAAALTSNPLLQKILANRAFARALVKTLDAMAHGEVPTAVLLPGLPRELSPFQADRAPGYLAPSANTSRRLTPWVDALCAIPPDKAARWLQAATPLLQQELQALGDLHADFPTTLREALHQVLATPEFDFPPELQATRRPGHYEYKDPVFQTLNPLQKALVRTGYENCGKLRQYARSLNAELALP
ncbi:MAG: DUF3014 domain-containing protein [Oligosphaeraceae bacterium]